MASDGSQPFSVPMMSTNSLGYLPGMMSMRERRTDPWQNGSKPEEEEKGSVRTASVKGNTGTWHGPAPSGSRAFRDAADRVEKETTSVVDSFGIVGIQFRTGNGLNDLPVRSVGGGAGFRIPLIGFQYDSGVSPSTMFKVIDTPIHLIIDWGACKQESPTIDQNDAGVVSVTVDSSSCLQSFMTNAYEEILPKVIFVNIYFDQGGSANDVNVDALVSLYTSIASTIPQDCAVGVNICSKECESSSTDRTIDQEVIHTFISRVSDTGMDESLQDRDHRIPSILMLSVDVLSSRRKVIGFCIRKGITVVAKNPIFSDASETIEKNAMLKQVSLLF